jgi:hypothetical protein
MCEKCKNLESEIARLKHELAMYQHLYSSASSRASMLRVGREEFQEE